MKFEAHGTIICLLYIIEWLQMPVGIDARKHSS